MIETWNEFTQALQHFTQPFYLYCLLVVAVLMLFLIVLKRRQPKSVVAYSTENGRVMVSRAAIVELVQTACSQLRDVSKPKVRIDAKGANVNFQIAISLMSGGHLRTVEETLQVHLRRALTENLGIERLGRIDVIAVGFKSGRVEHSSPVKTDKEKKMVDAEPEDFSEPADETVVENSADGSTDAAKQSDGFRKFDN